LHKSFCWILPLVGPEARQKKGKHVVYYRHVVWDMYMFFFMWCTLMLK
jgi:hypothetical protein